MIKILYTILFFIKKSSLIIFFISIGLNVEGRNLTDDNSIMDIFHLLPDEIFINRYSELQKPERDLILNLFKKGEYRIDVNSTFHDYKALKLDFVNAPNLRNISFLINKEENFIIIFDNRSDIALEYEIKLFQNVLAFRVQYSTHLTTEPGRIEFYACNKNKIKNITHKVLNSFNYWKDNYSDSTIDSLNKLYSFNNRKKEINKTLLYNFSENDTIIIGDNFELHFEDGFQSTELDKRYFDGEFFTKKYIMDNGKLRLAE